MKYLNLVLSFILIAFTQTASECECESAGKFLDVTKNSELVAYVKIKKYLSFKSIDKKRMPMSMEVEILKIFNGKESRKTVVVWGDNGILCRPYLSQFSVGKYYIIGFMQAAKGRSQQGEKKTDYAISICGDFWLNAEKHSETAKGAVSDLQESITFKELLQNYISYKPKE